MMKLKVLLTYMLMVFAATVNAQLKPGDKSVDFTLKNVDNTMVSLSDYSDQEGVIIVFTCNPCPFAQAYEERIIKTHNYFAPRGYPVIAINPNDETISPDDTFIKMQKLAEEKEYPSMSFTPKCEASLAQAIHQLIESNVLESV